MSDLPSQPESPSDAAAAAERTLSRVQGKVVSARAVLLRLLQEVVVAEARLSHSRAEQVVEANEQLVVAALLSRADALAARRALNDAPRTSHIDPLTQLPNRLLLRDRLNQAMATAKRKGTRLALLFVDLDDFKSINDTLGHAIGDAVLQQVAQRLSGALREADTVSRHGGDEFLLLLGEVSQRADVALVAGHVQQALGAPCHVNGRELRLTVSIGISLYPDDGDDATTLINHADAAMYRAKHRGRGGHAFHGEAPTDRAAPAAPAALPPPMPPTPHEQALIEQVQRNGDLRDANERLVLAALDARALQEAAERAQQRQSELMAAVVEELADPSAPVRLASTMLGRPRSDESLLPRVRAIIEQQVTHMSRLVAAANDLSRDGRAATGATQAGSDLGAVIAQVVRQCQPAIALREQHLRVGPLAPAVWLQADPERLSQILRNLLDNASKYSYERGTIRLEVAVADDQVRISVADDGIGITPEAMPGLFEPFVQDSRTVGFNGVGVGIGLPVVRFLVNELGGSVSADSAGDGQGSRFVVTLPRADVPAPGA